MRFVLLIESHEDSREVFTEYLRADGFDVEATISTDEGQTMALSADAVVTCLHPQGSLDGLAFIRWLRGQAGGHRVAVVVVSASVFPEDQDEARTAGCDAFLAKPCLPSDLARELRRAIALRHVPGAQSAKAEHDPRGGHRRRSRG